MGKCTKKWTQHDGTKIRICDMGDQHLLRTIEMLKRIHEHELAEVRLVASMADDFLDFPLGRTLFEESDHPLFDDLRNEAISRGLEV